MAPISRIITASVLAGLVGACGNDGHQPAAQPRAAIAVTAVPAAASTIAERLEAGGVIAARESAVISSRVIASIRSVRVKAGDAVRAGDVLVTLDARDAAAQARQATAAARAAEQGLTRARSEQAAAEAEHTLAAAWHKRIASLHARNSATAQELDEAEARLAAATARVAGTRAGVDQTDAALVASRAGADAAAATESFTVIRAPFDGEVTERFTDPGNLATPGLPLLRIDATGRRRVEVRVDESRAAYLHTGDTVDVIIERGGTEGSDAILEARVDELARAIAADQRAFTVKATLPPGVNVRTGTFARLRFRGAPRRALVIPPSALRHHGQVTSVFVVQDGQARLRLVQPGYAGPEGVEVLAGLDAGEIVVTDPPPALSDGHPVTVTAARAETGERR